MEASDLSNIRDKDTPIHFPAQETDQPHVRGQLLGFRLLACWGIIFALFVLSVLLVVSLLSADSRDPSLNHVIIGEDITVQNWLGAWGAVFADVSLQTLGMASFLLPLVFACWGWRMLQDHYIRQFLWRVIVFVPVLLSASFLVYGFEQSFLAERSVTPSGGAVGSILLSAYITFAGAETLVYGKIAVLIIALLGLIYVIALKRHEWHWLFTQIAGGVMFMLSRSGRYLTRAVRHLVRTVRHLMVVWRHYRHTRITEKESVVQSARGLEKNWQEPILNRGEVQEQQAAVTQEQEKVQEESPTQQDTTAVKREPEATEALHNAHKEEKSEESIPQNEDNALTPPKRKEAEESTVHSSLTLENLQEMQNAQKSGQDSFNSKERQEPILHVCREDTAQKDQPQISDSVTSPALQVGESAISDGSTQDDKQLFSSGDSSFELPSLSLLKSSDRELARELTAEEQQEVSDRLVKVLLDFNVQGEIKAAPSPGPVVTLYEFEPAPGTRTRKVTDLAEDIARSMSLYSVRMSTMAGRNSIAVELPNTERSIVKLRDVLATDAYQHNKMKLPLVLGCDIAGNSEVVDLATMPHLLIAGTTGSGKSVGLNVMILSLLYRYRPDECKFIMIDPKMLELSIYQDIPHLLSPVVTDPKKAVVALKWAVREMEQRYFMMSRVGVRNIENFNQRVKELNGEPMHRKIHKGFDDEGRAIEEEEVLELKHYPYIVVIVDEMADLMLVAGKEIEGLIQRLAQMARAAGIHIIMATQRPSVDVVTGTIKANFPSRISFMVSSKIDSRTVLGDAGAEQLLGKGDMLLTSGGGKLRRVHGPFVEDGEVEKVCQFLRSQCLPSYEKTVVEEPEEANSEQSMSGNEESQDPMFAEAVSVIRSSRKASTSFLQRQLQIGYNRAARLMDVIEAAGFVSAPDHVGKREILIQQDEEDRS